MRYISILLSLLATSSCGGESNITEKPTTDTVIIEYPSAKDTLIILDTISVVKKNASSLWSPKCRAYGKWRTSWIG